MSLAELENMSMAQKRMAAMPEPVFEEAVKQEADDVDMEASDDETTEQAPSVVVPKMPQGPIKIRTDYKPKLIGSGSKAAIPMQTCPRCGEAIPVTEMDEHMRIELLDSKWKEQKMAMEAKIKDSNLLHGTDVARNLKNFSGLRPDIFDADESETLWKLKRQQEEARKKDKIIWDGHTATMTLANQRAQQSSIEEQIAMMHRGDVGAPTDTIGPQIPGQAYQPAYPHQTMYFPNQTLVNTGAYNPGMPPPVTPAIRKAEDYGSADKKPRLEGEQEWPIHDPNAIHLTIQTPSLPDKPEWNLTGAPVVIGGLLPNTLITTVKDRIGSTLGMPAGKQKLSTVAGTVLNNSKTLAFYGIMNGAALVLEVRKR
ncbi:hypothetical protein G6F56_005673 [Rhizopus delemar]|nr:hypothetical protein G6F56_005673 [Rhizopus delemar]